MTKRVLILLAGAVLTAALAVIGYWLLFTQFMIYDDEGYVLWSLRTYFAQGGLYVTTYSQYGPFFYLLHHAVHAVTGLDYNNTTGRLITLACWVVASGLCGVYCRQLTRSWAAGAAGTVLTFAWLTNMTWEPSHPGGLIVAITALGLLLGLKAVAEERPRRFAVVATLTGILLTLTKINVGIFFLIATGTWMAMNARSAPIARACGWLSALGSVLVPALLMRNHGGETWAMTYALLFACAALALTTTIHGSRRPEHGVSTWMPAVAAGAGAGLLILLGVAVRGTGWNALWNGIVVAPLRHPNVYSFPVAWLPGAGPLGLACAGLAGMWALKRSQWTWLAPGLAAAKLAAGIGFMAYALLAPGGELMRFGLSYGLPLVWLMAVPLREQSPSAWQRARIWLAWVFTWQSLQAYPVAGSQMAWGTFLCVPIVVAGWHEALGSIQSRAGRAAPRLQVAGAVGLCLIAIAAATPLSRLAWTRYQLGGSLQFAGAENLRIDPGLTSALRILDQNVRAYGDTLFTYPGMFSFNLWTGRPTPTGDNVTHWFSLLTEDQQRRIIERLSSDPRAVVIINRLLIDYLIANGFVPRGPLHDFINADFTPAFRIQRYEFLVHRGRPVAPLSTATLLINGAAISLELTSPPLPRPVAAYSIRTGSRPFQRTVDEGVASPAKPWTIVPLTSANEPAGPPVNLSAPTPVPGLSRISIPITLPPETTFVDDHEIELHDSTGEVLALFRFRY